MCIELWESVRCIWIFEENAYTLILTSAIYKIICECVCVYVHVCMLKVEKRCSVVVVRSECRLYGWLVGRTCSGCCLHVPLCLRKLPLLLYICSCCCCLCPKLWRKCIVSIYYLEKVSEFRKSNVKRHSICSSGPIFLYRSASWEK